MRVKEKIDFAEVCAKTSLVDLATRAGVKLHRAGRDQMGCCPFHNESTPSFSIFRGDDRERFKCFGCGAKGDAIRFVELYQGVDTITAVGILNGLAPLRQGQDTRAPAREKDDKSRQITNAKKLYTSAKSAKGTVVETYLRDIRGIDLDRIGGVPASLRFDMVKFWANVHGEEKPICLGEFPTMLAPIQQANNEVTGLHMTYLDATTADKVKLTNPNNPNKFLPAKKIRGIKTGGCIRLGHVGPRLIMAEGIESVLSIKAALSGTKIDAPAWTCVDLDNFNAMRLPLCVTDILFAADNDMQVPTNSEQRNTRLALMESAKRITNRGHRVKIVWADGGADFNDMLTGKSK